MARYYTDENGQFKKYEEKPAETKTKTETKKKKKKEKDTWFKSGAFGDGKGNFFTDALATIGSTVADASVGVTKGISGLAEGVVDLGMYGVAGAADLLGADKFAKGVKKTAKKNVTNAVFEPANEAVSKYSVLGNKSDAITQGLGQVGGLILTGGVGAAAGLGAVGTTALTTGVTFGSSFGGGMSEAYEAGASDKEAVIYGAIKGGIDAGTEMLFGGLGKAANATGLSRGVGGFDDMLADYATKKLTNQVVKNATKYGIKAAGEGFEEVLAGVGTAFAKQATYMDEKEISELLEDENLLDQFITGALVSGVASAPSVVKTTVAGRDYTSGLTVNEQKVVDAEVESRIAEQEVDGKKLTKKEQAKIKEQVQNDLKNGYISTDTIERILATENETYKNYQTIAEQEKALNEQIETIKKSDVLKPSQKDALVTALNKEIEALNKSQAQGKLMSEIDTLTEKDTYLRESYNEKGRRSQTFEADLSKYNDKQKEIVQRAIDSKILNNTNRTHEFVDMVAKISSDKGVTFDFANNESLKNSGFAVDGATINGYVKDGNIVVNIQSNKALNTIVGHEVTHILEGTELYTELQDMIIEHAKTKGDYQSRYDALAKLYEGIEGADINNELTADLVGDYLFTDSDFINNLSVQKPNLFKRIYEELKYLLKIATGSKETRQLEQVKRAFDKVYKQTNAKVDSDVKYSAETSEDKNLYQYVQDALNDKLSKKSYYKISESISDRMAKDIEEIVGFSVQGYGNEISPNSIRHIRNEHGENGTTDNSMKDYHDLAKIAYVIENYDKMREGKKSEEFKNSDGTYAKTIVLQKKIDENFYYVVEAVPDAKNKTLHIVSAYKNKKDTFSDELVSNDPKRYVLDEHQPNVSFNNSVSQNAKMSISDNKGRTLTKEQQEYFKDSKVVDGNGKLIEVYHGTRKADFTVFNRNYNFFTDSKEMAGSYAPSSEIYSGYLNITNPFVIDAQGEKWSRIPVDEELKDLLEQYGGSVFEEDGEWRTTTADLVGLVEDIVDEGEGDYDGVIIRNVEDTGSYGNGLITANDYIAFKSNQFKNVDNIKPTSDKDIRYSLGAEGKVVGSYNVYGKDLLYQALDEIGSRATSQETADVKQTKTVNPQNDYSTNPAVYETGITDAGKLIEAKVENCKVELESKLQRKEDTHNYYNQEIARKQSILDAKKDKSTKVARDLADQIERLKRKRDDADADADKQINALKERIDKMGTKEYRTAEQRKVKQASIREEISELMGDTSTWKDKRTGLSYKLHTLKRNLRDVVGDTKKADEIYRGLQGRYNHNEAILNTESNKIKKQYADMHINKYEDQYIQMLGEYKYNPDTTLTSEVVSKFYEKHKNKIDAQKVDRTIDMARNTYDDLFKRVNEVLREHGLAEIAYREGYFPHFTKEPQGLLAKLLNWKKEDNSIPTDIAGLTEQFKPNKSWQAFSQHRYSDVTDYSFLTGLDAYVAGSLDWIHHINDIQRFRAFENEIRYRHSDARVQKQIKELQENESLDADEFQAQLDGILAEKKNPLNQLVQNIRTHTNLLAGKKNTMDRAIEEDFSRNVYSVVKNASSRINANMVGGSISSALTNFIPITQSWSQVSPIKSLRAMKDTIKAHVMDDGVIEKSDFLTNRLRTADKLSKTTWDKVSDKISGLMEIVDNFTSQTVWRSKYLENIESGMSENEAIQNADEFAEGVMAGRSRGNMPVIFESKNPIYKIFTAFQLEVANQYDYMLKDMPTDMKNEKKSKLAKAYASMFVGAYAYNALYSKLTGRDAAFDPIGIIQELLGDLFDDEEDKPSDILFKAIDAIGDETPYVGGILFDGGRIPVSSALPYGEGLIEAVKGTVTDIESGDYDNLTKEWLNPLYYLAMPAGGGQLKKTNEGLAMFSEDNPVAGSYTTSGNLRFAVEDNAVNRIQAALFGQWASENAQKYIEEGRQPLKQKQIDEFAQLGLSMQDYWTYRDGLKDKKTVADKFDYISNLNVTDEQKNIMINNLLNRKEEIDMSEYENYSSYEEFDFATNNPEKYEFFKNNNISYADYSASDESKDAYNWAYNNPEKYVVSKAVGDVVQYKQYTRELNNILADKDEEGNSISGSRKAKVISYLNNMDIDYGARMILYKSEYPSDDTYNVELIEYLDNRSDISYEEMVTILTELGFVVDENGTVRWK